MKNSVALITGGAGHIGRSCAEKLAHQGTHLLILDKETESSREYFKSLSQRSSANIEILNLNLLESSTFANIRSVVEEKFGRLDFVVNNAAFYDDHPGWGVAFEKESYEAWMKVMQVNLLAPFFIVQALSPLLSESPEASVVNVSSIYGVTAPDHSLYEGLEMTNPAAYAASKGGLVQLTKWLSTFLAPKIRVNCVSPGGVARGQNETFVKRYVERTPLKRMAKESDVASAISFLLSSESSYMTGQNLVVDGGWTIW